MSAPGLNGLCGDTPDFREAVGRAAFVSSALVGTRQAESLEDELGCLFPVAASPGATSLVSLALTSRCPNSLPGRGTHVPAKGARRATTQGLSLQEFSALCRALPLPMGPSFQSGNVLKTYSGSTPQAARRSAGPPSFTLNKTEECEVAPLGPSMERKPLLSLPPRLQLLSLAASSGELRRFFGGWQRSGGSELVV